MSFKFAPDCAVLGILMNCPKHGYEVEAYLSSKMGQFWHLSMSQVYALLKRIEKTGLAVSSEERQDNRPNKKVFSITKIGRKKFLEWVYSPVKHVRDLRVELIAKLFFIKELKLTGGFSFIEKQVEVLEKKLRLIEQSNGGNKDEFQGILYAFKIAQINSAIDWLKECKTYFMQIN
jgi:DNA-binding PadR family transcriptional regulator